MPPAWTSIQLAFRGGIDQKTVAEFVDPQTRLLDVVNGVFQHDGAVEKRPGMQALTTACIGGGVSAPTMGAPLACFTHQGGLLATDGESLYAYAPSASQWASVAGAAQNIFVSPLTAQIGALMPACQATRAPMNPNVVGGGQLGIGSNPSISEGAGFRLITTGTAAAIVDIATGAPLNLGGALGGGAGTFNNTGIIQNGFAFIFWSDGAGHIWGSSVNLTTGAVGSVIAIVSDAANKVFDVTPYTGATTGIFLVYNQTGHAATPRCLRLESLPVFTITASFYCPTTLGGGWVAADVIACRVDTTLNVAFIAWEAAQTGGTYVNVAAFTPTGGTWTQINLGGIPQPLQPTIPQYTQGGGGGAQMLSIEPLNSTQFWIQAYFGTGGGPWPAQAVYANSSGAQQSQMTYPDCYCAGRPFRRTTGGIPRLYVPMATYEQITTPGSGSATQFTSVLLFDTRAYETPNQPLSITGGAWPRPVATIGPRQASFLYYSNTANANSGNVWRPGIGTNQGVANASSYNYAVAINASEEFTGNALPYLASYAFTAAYSYAEGGGESFIAAGVPMVYDASTVREHGFHMWPSRCGGAQSAAGGGLTVSSTYGYAIVFAETDATGLIHRSAPYTFNVALDNTHTSVALALQGIAYTQRPGAVIEVYRTAASQTIYYFLTSQPAYAAAGISGAINITDTAPDTAITSNSLLYTTGGVLQSVTPPSFRHIIRHVERLWGIDDSGLVIWYSTPFSPSDAPWYNESLTLQFTDETLVALGDLDDKLVVFSGSHIWYVEGIGPNNLGQGSDLTVAVQLPSDVGCASPASVVSFPGGLFFQAPSGGIYLLDRGLNVSYIGKEVQDLTLGASVVAAHVIATSNHVRFVLSTGTVLTFDYVLGRWARILLTAGVFGTPIAAAVVNGVWSVACSLGMVAQEKSVTGLPAHCYQDSTAAGVHSFVTTTVKLAHLRPGGLDGWVQWDNVQGRADWLDPADVVQTLTFDYGASTQGPGTFTYANLHGAIPTQARWSQGVQAASLTGSAVQVTLSDAAPTGGTVTTGQGVRWLGVTVPFLPLGDRNINIGAAQKM